MANFELVLNPRKALKRKDVIKVGKLLSEKASDPKIDALVIRITNDLKEGADSIAFQFKIVDEK